MTPDYTLVRCPSCMAELLQACRSNDSKSYGTHNPRKLLYWERFHNKQLPLKVV